MNTSDQHQITKTLKELSSIRSDINQIDEQVLQLLSKRRTFSLDVAEYKQAHDKALQDQGREQELLIDLIKVGQQNGLNSSYIIKLFHTIIDDSLDIQQDYLQSKINSNHSRVSQQKVSILGVETLV